MCEFGFCGTKLTSRTLHSSSKYETPVWYCRNAANKGKHNCPNSKSVHESILENAFLEAYKLLAGSFDDVIDSVIGTIESIGANNDDIARLKKSRKLLIIWSSEERSLRIYILTMVLLRRHMMRSMRSLP